ISIMFIGRFPIIKLSLNFFGIVYVINDFSVRIMLFQVVYSTFVSANDYDFHVVVLPQLLYKVLLRSSDFISEVYKNVMYVASNRVI
ncbi:MAG: hypothetical protein DRI99_07905, partial [Candidatus Aminicenantes bacterium]